MAIKSVFQNTFLERYKMLRNKRMVKTTEKARMSQRTMEVDSFIIA